MMSPSVAFLVGLVMGAMIWDLILFFRKKDGTLKIDHSNPNRDVYRFEVDNLDSLDKKKRISLNVDHNANLSQD